MYDLHIHTSYSDGADTPNEVLLKAEALGLERISITDHDNVKAYYNLDRTLFSGEIITGIEMQALLLGQSIELLGYGFDIDKLSAAIDGLYLPFDELNLIELELSYNACKKMGAVFPDNVIEGYSGDKEYYATDYLHSVLVRDSANKHLLDDESWESSAVFFRKHTSNPESPFYIDESALIPSFDKVADIIRASGGKVFIPHIFQYGENSNKFLRELIKSGKIDGIECYYPDFTIEQTNYLLEICEKNRLEISGGSDYHGGTRKNKLGVF